MCAKDRSQIMLCSQTDSISQLIEMVKACSCPSLLRNSCSEFIYTNPVFDKQFLTFLSPENWLLSLPHDKSLELLHSEINSLSNYSVVLVTKVTYNNLYWTVILECLSADGQLYSKWTFIQDDSVVYCGFKPDLKLDDNINAYCGCKNPVHDTEWKVFNLHVAGISHAGISKLAGISEKTSKNTVVSLRQQLGFKNQDQLILSAHLSSVSDKLMMNINNTIRKLLMKC